MNSRPGEEIKMAEIWRRLCRAYPDGRSKLLDPSKGNPLDVLVATIISQATNDVLSSRAFEALKRKFPQWEDALAAGPEALEEPLSCAGLYRAKAAKIHSALSKVQADFGTLDLFALRGAAPDEVFKYLTGLPGVGPKTAACTMAFGFGLPAIPVDTHVLRVSRRLGLVPANCPAPKAQEILETIVPEQMKISLHVAMISHGREICKSKNPRCGACFLSDLCPGRITDRVV